MSTNTVPQRGEKITEETETISIEVELSEQDLKNVRRILEGKFEPLKKAWPLVKVSPK